MIAYFQLLTLVVIAAGVLRLDQRTKHMNDTEKAEFQKLNDSLESLSTIVHNYREDNNALKAANEALTTKVAELEAQLAAVPPVDDTAEVVAAVQVAEAKVEALIHPADTTPAV